MSGEAKTGRAAPGERMKGVLAFLKREKVTDELLFTSEHAHQAATELGMRHTEIWNTVRRLAEKGEFTLKKNKPGQGMTLVFNGSVPSAPAVRKSKRKTELSPEHQNSGNLTANDLLRRLELEIQEFETQLERKKILREEITKLVGRDS